MAASSAAPQWIRAEARFNVDAASAALATAAGDVEGAADGLESWISKVEQQLAASRDEVGKYGLADSTNAADYAEVGLAEEAAGRFDQAIAHFEKSVQLSEGDRASFDVASRLRFLRGRAIRAYWGLVRGYASHRNALGSARETGACLDVAMALGYVEVIDA